jgi:plasmid stabilization system protein ParE
MSTPVQFSRQALAQVQVAHGWWRKNRPRAPRLLREELAEALRLLRTSSGAGAHYPHRRRSDVRRLVLPRTRYYLYYVEGSDGVVVLAVWSALRGRAPPLAHR